MKALVQEGRGSADVLHLRDVPTPALMEGTVLVRMRAASVNALDWHTTHGGQILDVFGAIMRQRDEPVRGVDIAGTIDAVGPGVTRFKPGDDVFGGATATFAEYVLAREDRLLAKPADLSFEDAATIGVAGRTALQGVRDHAGVKSGQRVLVHGAGGGVGTYAVQVAKALGAHVTAVTGPLNVELVRSLGADEVVDYSREDIARRHERYDAVLDVAANRSVGSLTRLVGPGGIYVLVGAAKTGGWLGVFARIVNVMLRKRLLKQRVTFFVAQSSVEDLDVLAGLIRDGNLRPAIDRVFPLAEAREAVRYLGTGKARAKVVITA